MAPGSRHEGRSKTSIETQVDTTLLGNQYVQCSERDSQSGWSLEKN